MIDMSLCHVTGWSYGEFLCKAVPYVQGVAVNASINSLTAIACDRSTHITSILLTLCLSFLIVKLSNYFLFFPRIVRKLLIGKLTMC